MKKSNKKKSGIHFLNHGIFYGYTMFSFGLKYDKIIKKVEAMYKKNDKNKYWLLGISDDKALIDGGNAFGLKRTIQNSRTGEEKTLFYIILTEKFKFEDFDYCVLAHEVLHICQFFLKDIIDRNKEIEAEAYFHTHLMKQCLQALRK